MENTIKFYAIQNHEGKYFRAKGFTNNTQWVDSIASARIYAKPGSAKSQITFWSGFTPNLPAPKLVEITGTITAVIDLQAEMDKKNELKRIEAERRKKEYAEWQMQEAQRKLEQAKLEYEKALKQASQA